MNAHDIRFMEHALALAQKGVGLASPNPHVGCVVVQKGEIVGEGFHRYDGRDHAEVLALRAAGPLARGATLYVNLEPCNHTGRTGPCSEAILAAGIARVVAAIEDPNPQTAGGGFERLRAGGVQVESGVLSEAAARVNEAFLGWITTRKPLVTLKSALTLDGQLAWPGSRKKSGKRKQNDWISSEESRARVQQMRHASDALVTGIGTILADDPLLTDRSGAPRRRPLVRVVLDSKLRLPPGARVVRSARRDLVVFTAASLDSAKARKLQKAGVEVVRARAARGRIDLPAVLAELGRREILSLVVEAGPGLNGAFLEAGLVHKLFLFYAPKFAGTGGVPLVRLAAPLEVILEDARLHRFGPDFALEARLTHRVRSR